MTTGESYFSKYFILFFIFAVIVAALLTLLIYNPFTEIKKTDDADLWCRSNGYDHVFLLNYRYCQNNNCYTNQLGEEVCSPEYTLIP